MKKIDIKSKMERVDKEFARDLKDISLIRIRNGLEKEMLSKRELTRIMRNTSSYPLMIEELKTKPRKKQ